MVKCDVRILFLFFENCQQTVFSYLVLWKGSVFMFVHMQQKSKGAKEYAAKYKSSPIHAPRHLVSLSKVATVLIYFSTFSFISLYRCI